MKEYWICDHGQWYDSKEVAYEEQSQSALIHVMKVNPEREIAIAKMIKALESSKKQECFRRLECVSCSAREALESWRKAN